MDDMWDPNTWVLDDHEHRVYADETLEHYCIVDANVYPHLVQWKWSIHQRGRFERRGHFYLRRSITEFHMPDGPRYENQLGYEVRNRHRTTFTRFLHVEILLFNKVPQPTPEHNEGDHINRNTRDCRLSNLKWATRLEQVHNSNYQENMRRAREAQRNGSSVNATRDQKHFRDV